MTKVEPLPAIKDDEVQGEEPVEYHVVNIPPEHNRGRRASFLTETILSPQVAHQDTKHSLANMLKKLSNQDHSGGQEPKSKYRALIQKAAQRTIMIVRAKHSAQTVQKITVRFTNHQPTELPRTVKLSLLREKIVCHNHYDDNRKSTKLFREIFETSPELEAIVKDMFWYLVSSEFQTGKHTKLEQDFYDRVADNFTALFIQLQMNPSTRDSGVLEKLPDAMSQLLFLALHDAFPISRYLFDDDIRRKLITMCYSWFVGFVPAKITWQHWLPELSIQSQRKSAGLTEFPALRNRMRRAERLDKIKAIEIQNHQRIVKLRRNGEEAEQSPTVEEDVPLPRSLPKVSQRMKCNERATYSLQNSPLIASFLKRHNLENNAKALNVDLRLTNDAERHLDRQQALHQKGAPMQRKRPVLDTASYGELVAKFEAYGKELKKQYVNEKAAMHQKNEESKFLFAAAQKQLTDQYHAITSRNQGVHELSNVLVSKMQSVDRDQAKAVPRQLQPHSPGSVRRTKQIQNANS